MIYMESMYIIYIKFVIHVKVICNMVYVEVICNII